MLVTRVVTCAGGGCNVFLVERVTSTLTTHHSMAMLSEREIRNWLDKCDLTPLAITYCMIISGNLDVSPVSRTAQWMTSPAFRVRVFGPRGSPRWHLLSHHA
jgi:hypothetical protein